jgi:hypothetical protein
MGMPPIPPQGPDSMSQYTEIERKIRHEEEHPRQIIESEGNNKRTAIIAICAVVLILGALVTWVVIGLR